MKKSLALIFSLTTMALIAGGPFDRKPDGTPKGLTTTQPFIWNPDIDDLNPAYNNAQATELVRAMFAEWRDVPGSQLQIQEGDPLPFNVTNNAEMNQLVSDGYSPIIYDQGNALLAEIGLTGGVIAAAGPRNRANDPINDEFTGMTAIIGGATTNGQLPNSLSAVLLHEFGHGLGLGHSVVNGEFFAFNLNYQGFGRPAQVTVEVMYWSAVAPVTSPQIDDVSGFLAIYGESAVGMSGRGAIEGQVFLPDGASGADGVNIIVHDVSNGGEHVFINAASTMAWNTPQGQGYFRIPALPPGEYTVEVDDIANGNTGSYSDPVRTDGGLNNTILGPFPGPAEFYNGANESSNPALDDPTDRVTVTVTADQVSSGINMTFNRSEDEIGSLLPNVYVVPEVQTEGEQETRIGIVNSGDAPTNFDIYGFDELGQFIGQITAFGNEILPNERIWFDVDLAFGDSGQDVKWIQVGATDNLLVFAEFGGPGTITAYWASNGPATGLFMPHVAKNTTGFSTFLSAVNPTGSGVDATATPQPTGDPAALPELTTAFAQSFYNVTDLFGDDLSTVDWVQLQSTGPDGTGIAAMEYFVGLPDATRVASLGLTSEAGSTLRFLHVAADVNSFWTGLVYMNVGAATANITENYYDTNGNVIHTRDLTLEAGAKIDPLLLFDINNTEPAGTAWIEVSGDQPLVGYELFGSPFANDSVNYFAGLQGVYSGGTSLSYPHVQSGDGSFTGLVALNIGESTSDITFTAYNDAGDSLESATVEAVAPKTKITRLLNGLFSTEIAAQATWVKATATGSNWAGFALWGGTDGQTLSGMNAKTGFSSASGNGAELVEEIEDNNTFDTAQPLSPTGTTWNINVVGSVDSRESNTPINTSFEDIEDVYTFTLEETKVLVIAVSPEEADADLDLYVTLGQQSLALQRVSTLRDDPTVDWSAYDTGDESVAGVFEPGTYYVHVSAYDPAGADPIVTDYGLLITETPAFLETFESDNFLVEWTSSALDSDADGVAGFESGTVSIPRFNGVLIHEATSNSGMESARILTPLFEIPNGNLVVMDIDHLHLNPTGAPFADVTYGLTEAPAGSLPNFPSITYQPSNGGSLVFENISFTTTLWRSWSGLVETRADATFQGAPGTASSLGLKTEFTRGRVLYDNARVYAITTTKAAKSKRAGKRVMGRRGSTLQQKQLKMSLIHAPPTYGTVTVEP